MVAKRLLIEKGGHGETKRSSDVNSVARRARASAQPQSAQLLLKCFIPDPPNRRTLSGVTRPDGLMESLIKLAPAQRTQDSLQCISALSSRGRVHGAPKSPHSSPRRKVRPYEHQVTTLGQIRQGIHRRRLAEGQVVIGSRGTPSPL